MPPIRNGDSIWNILPNDLTVAGQLPMNLYIRIAPSTKSCLLYTSATQDGIYVEGSDVKAEIATGDDGKRIGFADSAILSTKGTVITVTDVNNKEFSMDVPGNAAGTVFDDSNNDGQSAAGAGTARTISQEVTDVGTMSIHVGANQDQVIVCLLYTS